MTQRKKERRIEDQLMSFDQSYDDNMRAFIHRLRSVGWSKVTAEAEWERVQLDEDEG